MFCLSAGADNANAKSDNIIITIKDTKLHVPVVTLSARDNQKLFNLLSKGLNIKSENKNATNEYTYFLESIFG